VSIASATSTASIAEQSKPVAVPLVPVEESARMMPRVPVPTTVAQQPTPPRAQTERAVSIVETAAAEVAAVKASPRGAQMSSPPTSDAVEAAPPQKMSSWNGKSVNGKTYSPEQLSNNLLGEAIGLDHQGRQEEAKPLLQRALVANPLNVRARQLLAQLQIDTGRAEQARDLLIEGQRLMPDQPNFTLTLARLQAEKGDVAGAIRALESKTAGARDDPQANALLGALLLQVERYDDAVQHYLVALRSDPANTNWLVGTGIALERAGKQVDAAEAYRRAQSDPNLTAETADFLNERLAQLKR
jgi:MSHA biogenesis protein MshN